MRWPQAPDLVCVTVADVSRSTQVTGQPGRLYDVEVRIRGVVETRNWVGGVPEAPFIVRGARSGALPPESDAWNVYELRVSQPQESWALNVGSSGEYFCHQVDSTFTFRASAGATVTLFASAVDGNRTQILNRRDTGQPIVVPGVAPAPAAFDGQFLQLDVLSVTLAP